MIVGASFDTPAENKAFAEKFHFPYDVLCDTDKALATALGLVKDPASKYAARSTVVIGPDGKIEQVIEKADAKTHPATLLATLPER